MKPNKGNTPEPNETEREAVETAENVETTDAVDATEANEKAEKARKKAEEKSAAKADKKEARQARADLRKRLRSRVRAKHRVYAVAITVVVLAVAILLNVLVSLLGQRFHLTVDLTAEHSNSITQENVDYLRAVDKDVTVTICAAEDAYSDFLNYYASSLYGAQDSTGKYYDQTLQLINAYASYNDHINVVYSDPQEPAFSAIRNRYPGVSWSYGDILVECSLPVNGKTIDRYKILTFNDVYTLEDSSGYAAYGMGYYAVTGSKIETALTSAIYTVTSDKTVQTLVIDRSSSVDTAKLTESLELNNYAVTTTSDSILKEIPAGTDLIVIAAPGADFAPEELTRINEFLAAHGEDEHGLLFFASTASPATPRLNAFLEDWGIELQTGTLFETDESAWLLGKPTQMLLLNKATDFTADYNNKGTGLVASGLVPMKTAYESFERRTTNELLTTYTESVIAAPVGADENYKPAADAQTGTFPAALLTEEKSENGASSFVAAFASADLISTQWDAYTDIDNIGFVVTVANQAAGVGSTGISFADKTVASGAFSDVPANSVVVTFRVLFRDLLPVAALVLALVVWIRRKNK